MDTMGEPSLTESFMEVACCDSSTAQRYLRSNAGDMTKAMARYFRDQEHRWDAAGKNKDAAAGAPRTQPAAGEGAGAVGKHPEEEEEEAERQGHEGNPAATTRQVAHSGSKRPASVLEDPDELDHLDPSLPWNKVKFGEPCQPGGKEEFAYDAIKTKVQMTNFAGPKEGSTWHWFLVADQKVFPAGDAAQPAPDGSTNGTNGISKPVKEATTYITGDKFQAGWTPDPSEKVSGTVMANRKASMIESILHSKINSYGKNRRGCKPGYSHRWTYANSEWADAGNDARETAGLATSEAKKLGGLQTTEAKKTGGFQTSKAKKSGGLETTECFWDEQKNEDRWLVSVSMRWTAPTARIVPGAYVVVADQVASKMNKNQYSTAMRGARYRLGSVDTPPEQLAAAKQDLLASVLRELRPAKPASSPLKKKQKKSL
ncbi:hypothetical protein DIPPA_28382 [Diplonema papillatum]|nr:hypothetical protein DIPPA_28382 [Diplonema papillatum]